MPVIPSLDSSGFCFGLVSVGGRWTWKVISSSSDPECVKYSISDILTPWGYVGSISVPIPSEVIESMTESLISVQEQFRPNIGFVDPSFSSVSATVVEGDSDILIETIVIMNTGAFGSFANIQASSSSPWIRVSPTEHGGVVKNNTAAFDIYLKPSMMVNADSPYSGTVSFTDGYNTISSSISVIVNPRPEILVNPTVLGFSYNITTDTQGSIPTLSVENSGPAGSSLDFTLGKVQNTSPWLIINEMSGSGLESGDVFSVTFGLNQASFPSLAGVYTEILRVSSNTASNSPILIPVTFTITG